MKTTAIVAAAGLVGAVAADTAASSSIQWEQWSTTTSEKPVDPTTTASAIEWESWSSTSSAKVDPTTTASAIEWESWSSTSQKVDPTTTASSIEWESWSSTSQKVDPTTTTSAIQWESWSSEDPKPTETSTSTWAEWSSSSPVAETQTSTWAEWSTSESPVADTTTSTWAEWSSAATPVAETETETQTWAEWESTSTTTVQSTYTLTKTIEPVAATSSAAETWAAWSSSSEVAATSTVAPAWSSAGWFGPQWPSAASGQCVMNVVTSYGYPTWNPVPEATTTWAEWSASASSSVSASSSAETWAVWTETSASDAATSTESSTWAVWTETSTSEAATSTESSTWAVWTESASASSTASSTWAVWTSSASAPAASAPAQGGKGGAVLGGSGNKWSMTYSPYTASGACKDSSAVSADIAKMASLGFSSVRVYSTDCKTLEYVGTAVRANNMKMILGVFISSTGINGAQGQVSDIVAWAQWDIVELVVIGNEAVFQGFCTASALATFIGSCKAAFAGAGYTGAVTTTEPLAQWQSSGSDFCGVVDVVSANLYAFFNPQTTAEMAGDFIQSEIELLSKICPGKEAYVMESGWPSHGECNGAACPSPENQATAIKGIQQTSGAKVVFFSFEDESWKQPGQFGVEQHWGCSEVFSNSWSKW